jgi:Ala-tRNA(Pro) deacylase
MPELSNVLTALNIAYERYDHSAVFTCEEAVAAIPPTGAVQTKNIFLRDKRGRRHLLLVTSCEKAVDIKKFAEQAHVDHLSFASAERLQKYLGVTPGSVTVLGLVNDTDHAVELFVDADVWHTSRWRCHPLVNTATLVLSREDVEKFCAHTGHVPRVVTIETRRVSGES